MTHSFYSPYIPLFTSVTYSLFMVSRIQAPPPPLSGTDPQISPHFVDWSVMWIITELVALARLWTCN